MRKLLIIIAMIFVCGVTVFGNDGGTLYISNNSATGGYFSAGITQCELSQCEGFSSGLDPYDIPYISGNFGIYSHLISGDNLSCDYRPTGDTVFDLKLSTETITTDVNNWLRIIAPVGSDGDFNNVFVGKNLYLVSCRFKCGYIIDIRALMAQGTFCPYTFAITSPKIEMKRLKIGENGIYDTVKLYITTGNPQMEWFNGCDCGFYERYELEDFALRWLERDDSCTDISGINGIPDGIINFRDLARAAELGWI